MREGVEKGEVRFRSERDVTGGDLSGFGAAWIDDHDVGIPFVAHHALPHDGVCDGRVGSDENEGVRFLEVGISVGRGVEAKGLFVGDHGGGHTLASVAVTVLDTHSEFSEGAEEEEVFDRDLTGGNEGDGVFAVLFLNRFEVVTEGVEGGVPIGGFSV